MRIAKTVSHSGRADCGMDFPVVETSVEKTRVARLFGYPGFWVVDMFDWVLVGLAAFDHHDEGYHYERCTRCCCDGDHGERLVTGACEVLG